MSSIPDNNQNSNSLCYICLENTNDNSISPCKCNHKTHIKCLLNWISIKKHFYCEICKSKYDLSPDSYNNYIDSYIDDITIINLEHDTNNIDRNIYNNLIYTHNNHNNHNNYNNYNIHHVDNCFNKIAALCIVFIIICASINIL